jgi:Transcriptional regulators
MEQEVETMFSTGCKKRRAIALFTQQSDGPPLSAIWRGMHDFTVAHGLDLYILDGRCLEVGDATERTLCRVFDLARSPRIDGIIATNGTLAIPDDRFADKPKVCLNLKNPAIPSVLIDNRSGIREAVGHLVVFHGRKRIAFLRGPESNLEAEERFTAYREALSSLGLSFDPSLAFPGDFTAASGRILAEALSRSLVPPFDALVSANDKMAIGFQRAAETCGIRVPEDVALTGFDDDEEAVFMTRPLTTIRQPFSQMCEKAGEMLLALMDGGKPDGSFVMPTRLVIRESCGCPAIPDISRFRAENPLLVLPAQYLMESCIDDAKKLFGILEDESRGVSPDGTFCGTLYYTLQFTAPDKSGYTDLLTTLIYLREESVQKNPDPLFIQNTERLLHEGQLMVSQMLERRYSTEIVSLKESLLVMNDFSRRARGDHAAYNLVEALDKALPETQINYAALSLNGTGKKDDGEALSGDSSLGFLYRRKARDENDTDDIVFPTLSILPDSALPPGNPMTCIAMALADSGSHLGFVFFDLSHPDATIYELFRSQISSILGRAKLMEALVEKDTRERVEIEKMNALGTLVSGVAHEINTPIGIGVTAASHLNRIMDDMSGAFDAGSITRSGLAEFLRDCTETGHLLCSNLERASALVSSFKKVAVDSSSEERRYFRVREYIADILATLSPRLKRTGIHFNIECPEDLEINSYPGAFSQILSNLIINSLVHAFDEHANGEISISIGYARNTLTWIYRDNGKGIPPDVLPHVFEPFFTTKRESGGSGLGLHIVYNTVTAVFAGRITLTSSPDKGVTFIITIPVKREEIRNASSK